MFKGISFHIFIAEYKNRFLVYTLDYTWESVYLCRIVYCIWSSEIFEQICCVDFLDIAC